MNMLRLKFTASFACSEANADLSRTSIQIANAASAPATPAIQLVAQAASNAAQCAAAAHWRSVRLGDRVCTPVPWLPDSIVLVSIVGSHRKQSGLQTMMEASRCD